MRLTSFTDYSLRTLLYLAANRDRLVTIQDIADLHVISKNHLMKVVYQLGLSGLVETVRGRNGGLRLAKEPKDINIGALVRTTETDFFMAECFDREHDTCPLTGDCKLKYTLNAATQAFLNVLDQQTLEDMLPTAEPATKPVRIVRKAV
ncbi:Rrf2 family transcriptional regulator [Duganella sp. FT80W]|uniref:Rrf2 family transcriptional regulator n=1 Tax=Duganella guangzhouensis TaxID=2666084 RepID=A0A6I2KXY9_9BURK|nr:Rrf2 family transcriptional regulator [Duganella guangzhouensis]MRW90623.1 Rrf2 family transcriptional regulator [Duganella guangzhouensis]